MEIVIALGVMVFAVVALVGLLSVGLNAGTSSQVATLDAMVAQEEVACLRTNALASWDSLSFSTNYFDYGGKPLSGRSGAYFACAITPLPADAETAPWATNAFRRFQLTIISPVSSPSPVTNVFHSAIARPLQ